MSINALTNAAASRRPDFAPFNAVPRGLEEIATASASLPTSANTHASLVAANLQRHGQLTRGVWLTFWVFLATTPLIVWLVYSAKLKAAQKPLPKNPRTWPLWGMFAATVAYSAWHSHFQIARLIDFRTGTPPALPEWPSSWPQQFLGCWRASFSTLPSAQLIY
jgi:hypothetical protein